MSTEIVDEINLALIASLQKKPSRTNKDIGEALGISEATVANRIRAMEEANILRVMMQRDVRALGYNVLALIYIDVSGRTPEAVANDMARIEECTSVCIGMGSPDIFANINARDGRALQCIIDEQISVIDGIASYEVSVALEVLKLDPRYGRLRTD